MPAFSHAQVEGRDAFAQWRMGHEQPPDATLFSARDAEGSDLFGELWRLATTLE